MKSMLTLIAIFTTTMVGLYVLDRQDRLPQLYTGPQVAKAAPKPPPPWYTLAAPFAVNLRDGRTARLTVALQLPTPLPRFVRKGASAGQLEQEAVIRALVTDTLMSHRAGELRTASGRRRVARLLRKRIRAHTDVRARRVVIPDVIVG